MLSGYAKEYLLTSSAERRSQLKKGSRKVKDTIISHCLHKGVIHLGTEHGRIHTLNPLGH